jgi:hypothetical protein
MLQFFILPVPSPEGCCISLSGLSAESEKKNQLCVLCVSAVRLSKLLIFFVNF